MWEQEPQYCHGSSTPWSRAALGGGLQGRGTGPSVPGARAVGPPVPS